MDTSWIFFVVVLILHNKIVTSQPLSEIIMDNSNQRPGLFKQSNRVLSGSHNSDVSSVKAMAQVNSECSELSVRDSEPQCDKNILANRKKECKIGYDCFQKKLIKLLDRFDSIKAIPIFGETITIVNSAENGDQRLENGEYLLPVLIWRIDRYLRTHSIRIRLPEAVSKMVKFMTPAITGEGRGRVKKVFFPLAMALMITLGTLLPILVSAIALISVKGLWAGLAALLMASTLAVRALFTPVNQGFAPRLAVVKPQFYPAEVLHHQSDIVTVPAWSRTGASVPELQYRGYPWTQ